jgi:hypothetical protein
MTTTRPSLAHLAALSDSRGVFEHAKLDVPRREHGYCLDDNARALIVAVREDAVSDVAAQLAETYLAFVDDAVAEDGSAHNRMDASGRWVDRPSTGDWWGRALWGLGTALARCSDSALATRAESVFHRAGRATSSSLRTMCFAALGSAELMAEDPQDAAARRLLERAAAVITSSSSNAWEWPEDRLHYANAVIPEALIAAGDRLGDDDLMNRGLELLEFLLKIEARDGHLSVTPVGGRGPDDASPAFDQQPIEVAAIADAATRAFELTGDRRWIGVVRSAWAWFEGDNDGGVAMYDAETGAGFDGLMAAGRNENRGAESTLAALSTLQCAIRADAASAGLVGASAHRRSDDGGRSSSGVSAPSVDP